MLASGAARRLACCRSQRHRDRRYSGFRKADIAAYRSDVMLRPIPAVQLVIETSRKPKLRTAERQPVFLGAFVRIHPLPFTRAPSRAMLTNGYLPADRWKRGWSRAWSRTNDRSARDEFDCCAPSGERNVWARATSTLCLPVCAPWSLRHHSNRQSCVFGDRDKTVGGPTLPGVRGQPLHDRGNQVTDGLR